MPWTFNPFTGSFDQKGSGGGGGASYIDGEVQNFSALPQTVGTPPVDSAYLVREAEGTWLINRKPAGIYIRTATTGTRASDWTYAGEFPDVFSDANFLLYDEGDSTKNLKFQLSGITTGTTRTLSIPNASGTISLTTDAPSSHAASHAATGGDAVFDQDLNTTDSVEFGQVTTATFIASELTVGENGIYFDGVDAQNNTRANLGLGTAATSDTGDFAASGSITSSGLTQATARILGRTDASSGPVQEITIGSGLSLSAGELSATGGSGISAVGASTADVLSVSGSDLVADDPNADRIVFWDDSESKWRYLEAGSGLSISGTTMTATASGGSKTYAVFTAEHNQPPASAYATLDTRNSVACLDFDDATDESAVFVGIIPEGASLGSGLKIRLHWAATTATSGDVRWDVQLERMTTDIDSDNFDSIASATATTNGTSGILTVTEITLTTIDSVTAGDGFRLKVTRDANNAADTLSGDCELYICEVRSAA